MQSHDFLNPLFIIIYHKLSEKIFLNYYYKNFKNIHQEILIINQ